MDNKIYYTLSDECSDHIAVLEVIGGNLNKQLFKTMIAEHHCLDSAKQVKNAEVIHSFRDNCTIKYQYTEDGCEYDMVCYGERTFIYNNSYVMEGDKT
jgi:hypothetical protein